MEVRTAQSERQNREPQRPQRPARRPAAPAGTAAGEWPGPPRARHCLRAVDRPAHRTGRRALMSKRWSKGQYGAYDRPPQGDLPAAVCIQAKFGQFPLAVFGMVRQQTPGEYGEWELAKL